MKHFLYCSGISPAVNHQYWLQGPVVPVVPPSFHLKNVTFLSVYVHSTCASLYFENTAKPTSCTCIIDDKLSDFDSNHGLELNRNCALCGGLNGGHTKHRTLTSDTRTCILSPTYARFRQHKHFG